MQKRYLKSGVKLSRAKAGDAPVIEGYASVWYDPDDEGGTQFDLFNEPGMRAVERIMPGAFTRAITDDDCRAYFNHDPNLVLGRCSAQTLRLYEDKRGLRYEIDPPDTSLARDLMVSLARGDIDGSSFSFDIDEEQFQRSRLEDGSTLIVRQVVRARLYDVGPVATPAYTGTSAGVRSYAPEGDRKIFLARANAYFARRGNPADEYTRRAMAVRAQMVEGAD